MSYIQGNSLTYLQDVEKLSALYIYIYVYILVLFTEIVEDNMQKVGRVIALILGLGGVGRRGEMRVKG